jgi:hypothetical protein
MSCPCSSAARYKGVQRNHPPANGPPHVWLRFPRTSGAHVHLVHRAPCQPVFVCDNVFVFATPKNLDEQPGTTFVRSTLPTLNLANTTLLGLFLDKFKPVTGQVVFVELRTKEGLENPDFGSLHAVRHGEVGWGLDCWGCASLYTVGIVDGKLR